MAYLYKQVAQQIREDILGGVYPSGSRIPGELQLMERFHVSRQTVRNALSDLTDEGLLSATQGRGTFVTNKTYTNQRTHLVGFGTISFSNYQLFPNIFQTVNNSLKSSGYSLIPEESENTFCQERAMLQSFLEKDVDALVIDPIYCGLPNQNYDLYKAFFDRGKPVIEYSAHREVNDVSYVVADDEMGGYLAAKHLIDYGHTRIAALMQSDDLRGTLRYQGICKALKEHGLPVESKYVDWYSGIRIDLQIRSDDAVNRRDVVLDNILDDCTAIIAYNDVVALYAMRYMQRAGLHYPEDISLVSFDDTDFINEKLIGITTVPFPARAIGTELGKTLLAVLEDGSRVIHKKIPVELIIRESTRRIT